MNQDIINEQEKETNEGNNMAGFIVSAIADAVEHPQTIHYCQRVCEN